jgi:hypothetical protein
MCISESLIWFGRSYLLMRLYDRIWHAEAWPAAIRRAAAASLFKKSMERGVKQTRPFKKGSAGII